MKAAAGRAATPQRIAACAAQVAEELGGSLHVVTRSGNPARLADQRRAAVEAADTVVLLWPSGLSDAEASAQQAAVLLTLEAAGGLNRQKVRLHTCVHVRMLCQNDAAGIGACAHDSVPRCCAVGRYRLWFRARAPWPPSATTLHRCMELLMLLLVLVL